METKLIKKDNKNRKIVLIFAKSLVLIIFLGLIANLYILNNEMTRKITRLQNEIDLLSSVDEELDNNTEESNRVPLEFKKYVSEKLGISFSYLDGENLTREIKNRIYVYYNGSEPESGQFVEVFDKDKNETVSEAIERLLLAGKDPSKCSVVTMDRDNSNLVEAEITYPDFDNNNAYDLDDIFEREIYCSNDYARTNGLRYFLYNPDHPTKLLFFSIGQYSIAGGENQDWHETLEFIE